MAFPKSRSLFLLAQYRPKSSADSRRESNATKFEMVDAGLSAFSVFFTQSPSFLDWQIRMQQAKENNNTLKTKGYHFEHNFGHGKKWLANLLATMILLAFLLHTALDWFDGRYRTVRNPLPSRRTFFEHMRALLHYLPFDSWDHLMAFMLKGCKPESPDTG